MDRRQKDRWDVDLECVLESHGQFSPCRLENISVSGAKLSYGGEVSVGEEIEFAIPSGERLTAMVVWRKGDKMGVQFTCDLFDTYGIVVELVGQDFFDAVPS